MCSSMCSSGKARAPSMPSWVMPAGQQAQSQHRGPHPGSRWDPLTPVGHGRLQAVQRLLILT